MPDPLLPSHFSSFDDSPLPASFSSYDEDTVRAPSDAAVGTGLSGIPNAPATWSDVGEQLTASTHELGATAAGFGASVAGDPTTEARLRATSEEQQREAEENRAAMTPTVQPGLSHPLVWAAEQAPGAVALAGPAALAGPFAPAVLAGEMGAQGRGDLYNRLTGQGIEPTSGQLLGATALGAASGLAMDVTGGLAGKLPVSKLVGAALGLGAEGGVFGASAGATEYTAEKDELAAGKRDDLDPGAILGATVSGLEQGVGLGALGIGRHGPAETESTVGKTRVPKGGVSAEPTRSEKDYRKPEALATAPVDIKTPDENRGPPPPAPKVDPAQASALSPDATGYSVTRGVTEPPTEPVEQPPVVQPPEPPSQIATEGQRQGDTTQPLQGPQKVADASAAPAPAPPVEDIGAVTPENRASLEEQHAALLDPGNPREAMLWPKGEQPIEITDKKAFGQVKLPDGRIVQFDKSGPSGFTPAKIRQYAKDDRLNEALGLGPVTKTEALQRVAAGEPGAVVTERTPDQTEVKAAAGTTATVPDQVAALEADKAPGNVVSVSAPRT